MQNELKHVLLIYKELIPSIRLCGHCQLEYLAAQKKLEYRAIQEMRLKKADLNWADIVLLGRLCTWYEYQLVKRLHAAGRYLVYILDDDLLNVPPAISSAAYYGQTEIQGYIRGMIELSDAILSPSPLLLEKYAKDGKAALQIEEPALDPVEYRPRDPEKPIKIGFAGSIDRIDDLEQILKEALLRIKQRYGDRVQFEFFGAIPTFAEALNAKCIPYCESYDEYRRILNALEWDIGLAPMPDTPFHACKHYNKFSEYAAAGIAGIYSNVYPYTRIKDMDCYGRFCDNTSVDWYEQMRWEIENTAKREVHTRNCCELAIGAFSVENIAINFYENSLSALTLRVTRSKMRGSMLWLKAGNTTKRGVSFVTRHGVRTPIVVAQKVRNAFHMRRQGS